MGWTTLCRTTEVQQELGKYVEIDGYRLAVFRDGDGLFVMDDACPHAGASLSAGHVVDGAAMCPRHAWAFQLADGQMVGSPLCKVTTYRTRILDRPGGDSMLQADLPIP